MHEFYKNKNGIQEYIAENKDTEVVYKKIAGIKDEDDLVRLDIFEELNENQFRNARLLEMLKRVRRAVKDFDRAATILSFALIISSLYLVAQPIIEFFGGRWAKIIISAIAIAIIIIYGGLLVFRTYLLTNLFSSKNVKTTEKKK